MKGPRGERIILLSAEAGPGGDRQDRKIPAKKNRVSFEKSFMRKTIFHFRSPTNPGEPMEAVPVRFSNQI
jgi:hypothetical protein